MASSIFAERFTLETGWVVAAGLAGATADFAYASGLGMRHGRAFSRIWQTVASGWLGKASFRGGAVTATLGLVTHVLIALAMAAAYAQASAHIPALLERPIWCGAAYGLLLYLVMYRLVLPLRWPTAFPSWDGLRSVADIAIHIVVGLAISLVLASGATALG